LGTERVKTVARTILQPLALRAASVPPQEKATSSRWGEMKRAVRVLVTVAAASF
jgi:hypothetical protein